MQAFVLAGGFATRLWPLTEKRAKPLLPLAGRPLLSHPVSQIPESVPVTVSTNASLADGFSAWKTEEQLDHVRIVVEDTARDDQKLGALGALAQWVSDEKINDDILLLAGDNYCGFAMTDFLAEFDGEHALLAAYDIGDKEQAKAFGTVILDGDGRTISQFEEKPAEPKTTLVSTGWSILPRQTLPIVLEYARKHPDNIGGIFEELRRRQQDVHCFTFNEPWFDIGSFSAYLAATKVLVGDDCLTGPDSSVDDTICQNSVVIGRNTTVKDSTLRNVVCFDDCIVDNCVLENCIIDSKCELKGVDLTDKMIRSGTRLSKEW